MELKKGDMAPDFVLPGVSGEVALADFIGKKVVLYFYPKDNTPGCTIEAIDFTKYKKQFEKKNAVIIGISKDNCESHKKFIDKENLNIMLLSDQNSEVQKKYGVWRKKKFMGKEYLGTVRSTFLIDEKGKILEVWDNVKAEGHAEKVLNSIQ